MATLLLLGLVPFVPPLRLLVPVEQSLLLLTPALAVCSLLSWWAGGRPWHAIAWILVAVGLLVMPQTSAMPEFDRMQRGWALLLAASFGTVSILVPQQRFLSRSLIALIAALVIGSVAVMLSEGGLTDVRDVASGELAGRAAAFARDFEQQLHVEGPLSRAVRENPTLARLAEDAPVRMQAIAQWTVSVLPALLALQSLGVLALAWALCQRLGRTAIGPPLAPLREFRFDDQFIWGLILGITLVLIPSLLWLRSAGWMLIVFFAGLYVLRGLAVAAWLLRKRPRWVVATLTVVSMLLLPPYAAAVLLGVGVGDTWADWRRRPPAPS